MYRDCLVNIDIHNHFFPEAYLRDVEAHPGAATVSHTSDGQRHLNYSGDYNVIAAGHISLEARIQEMDKAGMDMQVLTLTTPGPHVEEGSRGIKVAQLVNDQLAAAVRDHPSRFSALATLPMQDGRGSVVELERAVTQLGLPGVMVFSNVNGKPLWASEFWPIWEKAEELDAVVMIHPNTPSPIPAGMDEWRLVPLIGFCADTSVAAAGLVFSGVMDRFPGLKIILSHLGGVIAYLAERIERGWAAYEESRLHVRESPINYLQRMWVDTVSFSTHALMCAYQFHGADRLMLGSDYPHQIGDLYRCIPAIKALPLSTRDKDRILGGNAQELLRIG